MLHSFTQNNCFQGENTRHFKIEIYYVLHNRENLQSFFKIPSAKHSLFLRSFISGRQKLCPVIKFLFPFIWLYFTFWFLGHRLRQRSIERAMDLTDSFTWEDLPTTDADTGHLTAAGWIPLTLKYGRSAAIVILHFHVVQSTIRIVTNHETTLIAWYPFDWTVFTTNWLTSHR